MKKIQQHLSHITPMDLSVETMVQNNDFLLCRWEFENNLLPRDKVKIIHQCPMKSGTGIISVFEESLIELMCDSEEDGFVIFRTREGELRIPVETCPLPIEFRDSPLQMNPDAYSKWRSYLLEFHEALQKFQWFKKSKL